MSPKPSALPGVYLLFGTDSATGEELVYVGQARERKNGNGVLGRVAEHLGEERLEYFTHAILVITSDDSFGPTEISYLENAFYQQALTADRVRAVNGNDPSPGKVTEEKQAELNEFISFAKIAIGSLGYRVFEVVDDAKEVTDSTPADSPPPSVEPLLHLKTAEASASGRQTSDGFVVLAGARLRAEMRNSAPESARKNRERFFGRISPEGELLRDTLFTSPSAASDFLVGASTSGKVYWKTSDGVTLRDLERIELQGVTPEGT